MDGMNIMGRPQSVEDVARDEIAINAMHEQAAEERAKMPPKIGVKEIREATETLRRYQQGKKKLEEKIKKDEQYWKLRQWDRKYKKGDDYKPTTSWLWSCVQSRYSDAMDSYPTCNFLPRQEDDKAEAKKLSAIVPIIMEQNRYEETYSDYVWYTLKHGGGVQGIFWDPKKHNGLGDIEIKKIDYLNLFWESGVTDIQDSENLFYVELVNKKKLEAQYPETKGHLDSKTISISNYVYDDKIDTEDKAAVVDWYYKKYQNGKDVLHYVKYVNDVVLYATENDNKVPENRQTDPQTGIDVVTSTGQSMAERGLYDHGQYPFVNQPLYPIEGSLCGYGLIDIGKDAQNQIDVTNKAITENAVANAAPRFFVKEGSGINKEELLDTDKPIVTVTGNLQDYIMPIQANQLNGNYIDVLNMKVDELKFVTSNQDVANGQAPSGVTAASAIAALQETQGKNARSSNKAFYRAYRDVVYQVVELIRQFYDLPRTFRIAPDVMENSEETFATYTNQGLQPQPQMVGNMNMGYRKPEFDIEISAEKASPYKKIEQNELALSFYSQGFFNPQMADQALSCLKMMDFSHKEEVIARIQQNQTIMDQLLQYEQIAMERAQTVAMLTGNPADQQYADQIAQSTMQVNQMVMPSGSKDPMVSIGDQSQEASHMVRAREQARETTQE